MPAALAAGVAFLQEPAVVADAGDAIQREIPLAPIRASQGASRDVHCAKQLHIFLGAGVMAKKKDDFSFGFTSKKPKEEPKAETPAEGGDAAGGDAAADPFASSDTGSSDPFASTDSGSSDPFASTDSGSSDPFASADSGSSDPFASSSDTAAADPFAGSDTPAADPFASTDSSSSDPFASTDTSSSDPFASTDSSSSDPFATSSDASSDPFASAGDSSSSDPFASGGDATATADAPADAPAEETPAAAAAPAKAEKPKGPQPIVHKQFRILVMGDFSGRSNRELMETGEAVSGRKTHAIDSDSFERVMQKIKPEIRIPVGEGAITLQFRKIEDFRPEAILEKVEGFQGLLALRDKLKNQKTFKGRRRSSARWRARKSQRRPRKWARRG
jgi:type VI secretion system ImpB/VipA family protein